MVVDPGVTVVDPGVTPVVVVVLWSKEPAAFVVVLVVPWVTVVEPGVTPVVVVPVLVCAPAVPVVPVVEFCPVTLPVAPVAEPVDPVVPVVPVCAAAHDAAASNSTAVIPNFFIVLSSFTRSAVCGAVNRMNY